MTNITEIGDWLDDRLPALIEKYDVPAAAIAVRAEGVVVDSASGLLSKSTGVEATTDSLFQIGSITKVWTATLVMQLVDEGLLSIDDPVRRHLPEFHIGDEGAAATITVRELLSHTAGFEGDIFKDTGKGDDCVEKYLSELTAVQQVFPPGEMFSYNNAGYCVLGRLVEVIRGKPYDDCLLEHLITPLGLTHTATDPYGAIMFRAAVGHVRHTPGADLEPAPVWALPRSNGPAGSMLAMRARDLIAFTSMHIDGGSTAEGTTIIESGTAASMMQRQVDLPDLGYMGTAWGLGWEMFGRPPGRVIGHDGNTLGQAAFLRIVPERGVAVCLLTNGGDSLSLYHDVVGHLLAELAEVQLPAFPTPPDEPERIDASRYVGTYSAEVIDFDLTQDDDGRIWVVRTPKGIFAEMGEPPERKELVAYGRDRLLPREPEESMHLPHVFLGDDGSGRAQYLHVGRAIRRAEAH